MTSKDVTIEEVRDGLRITVQHDATDSLAIIEVKHRHGTLGIRSGLRGNLDAHKRRIQWSYHSMGAPLVSAQQRLDRALAIVRRNPPWLDSERFSRLMARLAAAARNEDES